MPKNTKEERLRWVLPIANKEVKLVDVAKVCPHSKRTLERWLSAYKERRGEGLKPKSTRPKTNPKETPIWQKERALDIRRETKKCALKIKWDLEEQGIFIHERTLGKFIKQEGLTRKYRVRKVKYKYVRVPLKPGELIEVDVKYVPHRLQNKQYFQYTAIDVATRLEVP
jgi:transposase